MKLIGTRKLAHSGGLWIAVLVFGALMNPLMLTGPLFMLQVYDRVIPSQSSSTLAVLFVLAAFMYTMMALLDSARVRIMVRIAARVRAALDRPVFEARLHALVRDPTNAATIGALRDLDAVHRTLASSAPLTVFDTVWAFVFFGVLFLFHPALGIVALLGGLALIGLAIWGQWRTRQPLLTANDSMLVAERHVQTLNKDAEAVTAMGMGAAVADRWENERNLALSATLQAQDRSGLDASIARAFRMMMQSAILAIGAWLVLQGQLSPGLIVAASILMGRALAPVELLAVQWTDLRASWVAWRRIQFLISTGARRTGDTKYIGKPQGRLLAQGMIVTPRGGGAPILRIKGFEVQAGTAMGVIGPSGSGKSTLARALIGSVPLATGSMRLGDTSLPLPQAWGSALGYVPQGVALLEGSIGENISRFDPEATHAKIEKAARDAGLHEFITALPKGYDDPASGPGAKLSGGQVQRVGLARALYGSPSLVILDEPNAHQDSLGQAALNAAVQTLKERNAVILIMAHRPAAINECELLLVLDGGAQVAFGPRDKVLRDMVRNHTKLVQPYVGAKK
jgi:ATP-binding cassette subfamily C protein